MLRHEYVSGTLMTRAGKREIAIRFIQPGKPRQNACVGRDNRAARAEWLGQHIFETVEEVQRHATQWIRTDNNERPNMAIGAVTPATRLKAMKLAAWFHTRSPWKMGGLPSELQVMNCWQRARRSRPRH